MDRTCPQDRRLSKKPRIWSQMTCLLFQDYLLSCFSEPWFSHLNMEIILILPNS